MLKRNVHTFLECVRTLVSTRSTNTHTFLVEIIWCQAHSPTSWLSRLTNNLRHLQTKLGHTDKFFLILVLLFDSLRALCYYQTIVGKFGRQICQVQLELLFVYNCFFLELEDRFVLVQLELLFVSSCVFLELEYKFFEVRLEFLFVSSCFFLDLEDKFVQV